MTVPAAPALPVLDMAPWREAPDSPAAAAFVAELGRVTHEIGFFYVVGHGVPDELAGRVHDIARRFFALPEEQRLAIENVESPQFRGYTRFGHERTNGRVDLRDQIDIGREDPPPVLGPEDPAWLRLRGPNLWPAALPELRPAMLAWMDHLERVGHVLLRAMAHGAAAAGRHVRCGRDPARGAAQGDPLPHADAGQPDHDQGVGAHRDTGFLSFVHQDRVGGLQVERDGRLIDVPALPGALVVNIGEMFQLVTRGYYKATVHRVVGPPAGVDRISLAYFFNPKLEATLTPVELAARPRRPRSRWRQRRPGQPDPRQLRRQLAEGAPAGPPGCRPSATIADLLAAGTWG